jgi:hypothetical protein
MLLPDLGPPLHNLGGVLLPRRHTDRDRLVPLGDVSHLGPAMRVQDHPSGAVAGLRPSATCRRPSAASVKLSGRAADGEAPG